MDPFERYVLAVADRLVDAHDLHPEDASELMDMYRKDIVQWERRRIPVGLVADALMERLDRLMAIPVPNPRPTERPPGRDLPDRARVTSLLNAKYGATFRVDTIGPTPHGFAFAAHSFAPSHSVIAYATADRIRIFDRDTRQWVHENPMARTVWLLAGLGGLVTAGYLLWMRKKLNGA